MVCSCVVPSKGVLLQRIFCATLGTRGFSRVVRLTASLLSSLSLTFLLISSENLWYVKTIYRPFPSSLVPLFQNESRCGHFNFRRKRKQTETKKLNDDYKTEHFKVLTQDCHASALAGHVISTGSQHQMGPF